MKKNPVRTANPIGAARPRRPAGGAPAISSPPSLRLDGWTIRIAPFSIQRGSRSYATDAEIAVDLRALDPGRYRLVAVHNFHVEDRNPRLDECVAGVFVAGRRRDGAWEEPERFPIECRAIALLAEVVRPASERGRPRLDPTAGEDDTKGRVA
ncbi:MAG TPA: hypothetical protein VGI48_20110 [Caldimonas sp.]|jgi:hypothetical protein